MELKSIKDVQKAEGFGLNDLIKLIGAITFILLVIWYVSTLSNDLPNKNILIITAIFGLSLIHI